MVDIPGVKRLREIHYGWFVVAATFLALLLATGTRSTFGVFVVPLQEEFSATRADIALVASISIMVNGANQLIMGHLLDRYGARSVAIICLALGVAGLLATSAVTGLWQMYITFGLVVSVATGGPSSTMATVVAARWFSKHRGLVTGLLIAGNAAGTVILVPVAMHLNLNYGWRMSHILLAVGLAALTVPIALLLRSDPSDIGKQSYGASELGASGGARAQEAARKTPLGRAMRTQAFWTLSMGYFVCGLTGQGVLSTHLVAYGLGQGIDPAVVAAALAVIGVVSIAGTVLTGFLADRMGRKNPLAAVYFIRGISMLILIAVNEPVLFYVFAVIYGLASFATVPPTAALTSHIYGRLSAGVIFGAINAIHQVGGGIGAYGAGLLFDLTGTYYSSFLISAVLCFLAAAASYAIREQPLERRARAAATG